MLATQYRLRQKRDFSTVYKKGKALNTAFFRIHTCPKTVENTRIGVVIANKVIKRAFARNRVKRQVRAIMRELHSQLITGYDIVIVAKPDVTNASFIEMRDDLVAHLQKIHFFQENGSN